MFTGVQFTHFIQANPALAVFLTVALGFLLGKLRIRSFSLGTVTSVLLVGVVVGQLRIEIPEPAKTLFFLMFLFAVGYAVGPQFFRGLKKDGLPQVAFAVVVCLLCLGSVWLFSWLMGYTLSQAAGLYVMAVSFAPELIPVHLLAKLAQGEASTPLPPMPEMLAVTLLLEIVREAGLRAPKSISHTVSLVGALIIGETAVSAGIISVPVLTMAAAATIATLAVPALYEQSILFRFVVILLAGLFGVPGLACGALLILAMACGSDPFGYDYLYPLMPPGKAALRDGFVRAIWSRLAQKGEVLPRHAKE